MTIASARKLIKEITDSSDKDLDTYIARGRSLGDCVIGEITLESDLSHSIEPDLVRFLQGLSEREWIPYDPAYQLAPNQAFAEKLKKVAAMSALEEIVSGDDVGTDRDDSGAVLAMVHRISSGEDAAVTVFRVRGAGIATRRAKGVRAFVPNNGVFIEVESDIIYYEDRFDGVIVDDLVLVCTTTLIARALEASEKSRERAEKVFKKVTKKVRIAGRSELLAAVQSDPAMVAKMMSIDRTLKKNPTYINHLTTEKLIKFISSNPQVGIETKGDGAKAKLVFDRSPQNRYRIVKALADDYLYSQLSGLGYEAGSKLKL